MDHEFLVSIEVELPPRLSEGERDTLMRDERRAGEALVRDGLIYRIWRLPGRLANVGIWRAPDATALHERLESLPMARYARIQVIPLAVHPLERTQRSDERQ